MVLNIIELPNEMLLKIFSFCSVEDLVLNIQYVNAHWRDLVNDVKNWKHLSYCPSRSVGLKGIIKVLTHAPMLHSLVLLEHVDELMINIVCTCCPLITTLEFYDIHTVTVQMLEKISKYLTSLENLTLRSMDIESQKFASVLGQFHKLKKLSLLHTFYMGADLLKCIADGCMSLEYLRLDGIDVNDTMVQYFINKKASQLKSILLDGFRLSSASLHGIKECVNLEEFMFYDCTTLTEGVFLDIVSLPKIRNLQLPEAYLICPNTLIFGLRQMNLSGLTELNISKSFLNDTGAKCLAENCRHLKYLNLASCKCLTDSALKYISSCCELQHLNVKSCVFTDEGMIYLPSLRQLRYLNISRNKVTDVGLEYVMQCSQLTGLQMNYCSVSASCVKMVLSVLSLSRFSCTDYKICFNDQNWSFNKDQLLQMLDL